METNREITKPQKYLIHEISKTGLCFMKLKDVLEKYPTFKAPIEYEKMGLNGKTTGERYVKGAHVKFVINDALWHKLPSELFYNWFRVYENKVEIAK